MLADRAAGGERRWLVSAGVLCGLAVLTRSNAPALILPLAIAVATTGAATRPLRARLGRAAALVGIAALVVAPWTIRNAIELDGFAPVTTEAGSALAGTYNDVTRTDPSGPARGCRPRGSSELRAALDPVRGDEPAEQRALMRRSLGYMADHPGYVAPSAGATSGASAARGPGLVALLGAHAVAAALDGGRVSGVAFLVVLALAVGGRLHARRRARRRAGSG